jgi:hypothetical protein
MNSAQLASRPTKHHHHHHQQQKHQQQQQQQCTCSHQSGLIVGLIAFACTAAVHILLAQG